MCCTRTIQDVSETPWTDIEPDSFIKIPLTPPQCPIISSGIVYHQDFDVDRLVLKCDPVVPFMSESCSSGNLLT